MQTQLSPNQMIQAIHNYPDTHEKWLQLDADQKRAVLNNLDGCGDHDCLLRTMRVVNGEISADMKTLTMRKTITQRKQGRYLYEVIEDGRVIAKRRSNRNYVACNVIRRGNDFDIPVCYSRGRQIKDVPAGMKPEEVYALARLN